MSTRLVNALLISFAFFATDAFAQDLGIAGSGLISIQPIDDGYVGGPYLSEGIGGFGPGFGASASVIAGNGFAATFEYTTAWYEQEQSGRLVRGPFPLEGIPATTQLKDSLVSVLAGYATGGSTKVVMQGGISFRLNRPTIDGVDAERYDNDEDVMPALTGGIDLIHPFESRVQLLITGRYTFNERDTRLQYLGIGPHIIRAGAGIRIKLN
jgi:hypothetical protein